VDRSVRTSDRSVRNHLFNAADTPVHGASVTAQKESPEADVFSLGGAATGNRGTGVAT
jgi:hypothetical protein